MTSRARDVVHQIVGEVAVVPRSAGGNANPLLYLLRTRIPRAAGLLVREVVFKVGAGSVTRVAVRPLITHGSPPGIKTSSMSPSAPSRLTPQRLSTVDTQALMIL